MVALVVRVDREQRAARAEIEIIGIAKAIGEHIERPALGRESHNRPAIWLRDRRRGFVDQFGRHAGVIATHKINASVGPFHHSVGAVFRILQFGPRFRLAIGAAIVVAIAEPHHLVVAGANQIVAIEEQSMRTGGRERRKQRGAFRSAVAIAIVQGLHIAGARDDHFAT